MIVCVCSNVSEKKIQKAIDNGLTKMSELRNQLDIGTCCGKCNACAKRVLREHLSLSHAYAARPVTFNTAAA